ncbi:Lrp/AsnC family transcriptional regulator [Sphingopyxis sp. YR583]|uniref:Lrp/AsnC family transcriptional regulator n=1 Tax=Sphingopyxis sp. YR583 TaxID=1881047 RepID=UPI0008A73F99|nr:Lrp/AsnC family transcriptional regulator [Sphingopyxis sp. YR583]SEH12786.1 Lrp/AsnC family transcriptional regulator [Sphingopyxis sp. YR583]
MDAIDIRILGLIQEDDSRPLAEVARIAGLSRTGCWHRIRRMEAEGVIHRRVALLDAARLGKGTTAFVTLKTQDKSDALLERLRRAAAAMPQAVELHRVTGGDYLLKLRLPGVDAYDEVFRSLAALLPDCHISATFSMDVIKDTTAIPLP